MRAGCGRLRILFLTSEADCFAYVCFADGVGMIQIRNGSGHPEKMVVASGAETQTGKSIFHHTGGLAGKAAVTVLRLASVTFF